MAALPVNERSTSDLERQRQGILFDIAWNLSGVPGARLNLSVPTKDILTLGLSK